ncbi:MAG: toll/interleukin-1 receptor domain-containing protein [Geminicoccaceae bacterium]
MLRLFLSYASHDADRVRRFSADLRRPGIEPWMDDELKLAGQWNIEIEDRIAACDLFLAFLSRATQDGDANRFFRREWQLAHEAQRRFLPVRLEECRLPASLPEALATAIESRQREDLFPSYEEGLRRILRFLHEEKRSGVFEETFSCLGPDNAGWRLGDWQLDDADSTGENSRSLHAVAEASPTQLLPQAVRRTAAIDIDLPGRPLMLRYRRRLQLSAPVGGEAGFQVVVDGEVVDSISQADAAENDWSTRSVPVPDRGARRATLELTVTISSSLNYFPSAEAWVDDLRIA